jgi:hypothetical protein
MLLIRQILLINAARNRGSPVVVQVKVELTVTSSEFELLQEQRVVAEGEGVEDVKLSLVRDVSIGGDIW